MVRELPNRARHSQPQVAGFAYLATNPLGNIAPPHNTGGTMNTIETLTPFDWVLVAAFAISLGLYAVSVWRYRLLYDRYIDEGNQAARAIDAFEGKYRNADQERIVATVQLRDARHNLAIERARVDHSIGIGQPNVRAAARASLPFPDFGHEPAGVRTVDAARRAIEERVASNGNGLIP